MNLVLFDPAEIERPLSRADRRAVHVLDVLKRAVGDTFDAGVINGTRGKATLTAIAPDTLTLSFSWDQPLAPLAQLCVIVGMPRPQTARDILREATTLGATALHFVATEKGDRNYAQSTLWTSGEWRRQLVVGAEQAFDPRIPETTFGRSLVDVLATLTPESARIALDNYEAALPLGDWPLPPDCPVVLALGAERGWSTGERDLLRAHCFGLAHLGPRVLRTETAVIAALSIVRAKLGLM